ncbi:MAG: hypothetical protein HFI26_12545 [Lachnospiraceae bacterium]|jgi:hypothetical protein|nr:hypothetical protein [Lachnospiraceae bacterium]
MRRIAYTLAGIIGAGIFWISGITGLAKEEEEHEISYDQVASESERAGSAEVGIEGMTPIYGTDITDGVYEVTVESSSPMFPIEKALLTVENGSMTAVLTMGGQGYLKVYPGTGTQAASSDPSQYIDFQVNEEGKHTFTIPVEALDQPIACAAFSKNREKWYDRFLLFEAESLPKEAVLVDLPDYEALKQAAKEKRIAALREESEQKAAEEAKAADNSDTAEKPETANNPSGTSAQPAFIEMEDGEYAIEVEVKGGTGRTTISSPAGLLVRGGQAYARIEWSSTSYDYMLVGGKKYLPLNEEGYSTFEIPITIFNEPMEVIADTTAMSTPHEITYQLIFHGDAIMSKNQTPQAAARRVVYMVFAIMLVCALVSYLNKRKRRS